MNDVLYATVPVPALRAVLAIGLVSGCNQAGYACGESGAGLLPQPPSTSYTVQVPGRRLDGPLQSPPITAGVNRCGVVHTPSAPHIRELRLPTVDVECRESWEIRSFPWSDLPLVAGAEVRSHLPLHLWPPELDGEAELSGPRITWIDPEDDLQLAFEIAYDSWTLNGTPMETEAPFRIVIDDPPRVTRPQIDPVPSERYRVEGEAVCVMP